MRGRDPWWMLGKAFVRLFRSGRAAKRRKRTREVLRAARGTIRGTTMILRAISHGLGPRSAAPRRRTTRTLSTEEAARIQESTHRGE